MFEADGGAVAGAAGEPHGDVVLRASWGRLEALWGATPRITTRFHDCTRERVARVARKNIVAFLRPTLYNIL
jgi:hypothetical protein